MAALLTVRLQTYIGNVIVSMNPYANVDIYKPADIENYRGKCACLTMISH